jgi:hypothetical protein
MQSNKPAATVKETPNALDGAFLLERQVFIEKVEQRLAQVKQKKLLPHSIVKQMLK